MKLKKMTEKVRKFYFEEMYDSDWRETLLEVKEFYGLREAKKLGILFLKMK